VTFVGRISLQWRLMLALLLMLALSAVVLTIVLARTYDSQLQAVARHRLQQDLPLLKSSFDELRLRDLHLIELIASNPEVVSGAEAHDSAALDKVLGPLRSQTAPVAQFLTVVDTKGQIIATDPFTNLTLASDTPVKDSVQGKGVLNIATTTNSSFWVRPNFPNLSIEAAWPVKSGGKTVGAAVLINVIGDGLIEGMLASSQLQAAIVSPRQPAVLAGSLQLRQLNQQQKLPGWTDNLDQKGGLFRQPVTGGDDYYFLQTAFPSQPAAMRLLLGVPGKDLTATAATLRRQLAGAALIVFLALALLGFLLLHWTLRPVRQLRRAAARIQADSPAIELSKVAPSEVREIAAALSGLAADLASTLETEHGHRSHIGAIIDSMAEGVVVSDVNRRVTLVNPIAKRLLGINGADSAAALLPLSAGDLPASNSKVIKSRSAPIIAEDGRTSGYVTLLHDASEEAELDRLKSEFVGVVSHELRTPLTSIKGSVDLLLEADTGDLNPTQRRFLSTIRRSSDRLINLVNDLLDLSRLEAGRVQLDAHPVDSRHLVEDTVNSLGNLFAAKKQLVRINCAPGLPPILADRQRLEQVLVNLLGNANKYTPESGEVCVATRRVLSSEFRVQSSTRSEPRTQNSELVEIAVSDTGPGLSPDDQLRVFEKFYRAGDSLTQQQQTGSGLGLTIARSLVELHGGTLTLSSEMGKGSTFSVALPIYEEED
jgi:signal transduction histidine kinase